jgi:hypothetical protein
MSGVGWRVYIMSGVGCRVYIMSGVGCRSLGYTAGTCLAVDDDQREGADGEEH